MPWLSSKNVKDSHSQEFCNLMSTLGISTRVCKKCMKTTSFPFYKIKCSMMVQPCHPLCGRSRLDVQGRNVYGNDADSSIQVIHQIYVAFVGRMDKRTWPNTDVPSEREQQMMSTREDGSTQN